MSILKSAIAAAVLVCSPVMCVAQSFPNKPIRLIVPFTAGGPNDIIARVVGQRMSDSLKQPVVIENREGQGGVTGTDQVARSKPDGYTLALTSAGALAISPSMQKVNYDPLKDLAPVTLVAKVPEMLVVSPKVPANNMQDLLALIRKEPGKLNFASSGPGSLPHLAGELFKLTAKLDLVHVPYRGAAPAVNDLVGGQVEMAFFDLPVLLPQVQSGALKAIAIGAMQRAPSAPNVPSTAEVGLPSLQAENWYGIVAPAGLPQDVMDILHKASVDAIKDPAVLEKLSSQGAILVGNKPDEFRAFIASETQKWAAVIKDAGIATEK
jgi:tripartite-type tricarboxylate transporter receptor subunit TctC